MNQDLKVVLWLIMKQLVLMPFEGYSHLPDFNLSIAQLHTETNLEAGVSPGKGSEVPSGQSNKITEASILIQLAPILLALKFHFNQEKIFNRFIVQAHVGCQVAVEKTLAKGDCSWISAIVGDVGHTGGDGLGAVFVIAYQGLPGNTAKAEELCGIAQSNEHN
jgi:hypothetical protein